LRWYKGVVGRLEEKKKEEKITRRTRVGSGNTAAPHSIIPPVPCREKGLLKLIPLSLSRVNLAE